MKDLGRTRAFHYILNIDEITPQKNELFKVLLNPIWQQVEIDLRKKKKKFNRQTNFWWKICVDISIKIGPNNFWYFWFEWMKWMCSFCKGISTGKIEIPPLNAKRFAYFVSQLAKLLSWHDIIDTWIRTGKLLRKIKPFFRHPHSLHLISIKIFAIFLPNFLQNRRSPSLLFFIHLHGVW